VVDLNKQIWGLVGSSLGNVRGLNSRMPRWPIWKLAYQHTGDEKTWNQWT
jgi:hypothetical protein